MKKIGEGVCNYFKGVKKEIGRIRWTTGKELWKNTAITLAFMLVLGIYFYAIDMLVSLLRSVL